MPRPRPEPRPGMVMILCNGEWKEIPLAWWDALDGPKPPIGFENDGCTMVPDQYGSKVLWPACVIHDWHYSGQIVLVMGENAPSRFQGDMTFMHNTYRILRLQGVSNIRATFHAAKRFVGVRRWGEPFFRRGGQ